MRKEDIVGLIRLVEESKINELEICEGRRKIRISKGHTNSSAAAGGTPMPSANASPSARAALFKPSTRLLISFIFAALPHAPTWKTFFPITRHKSAQASNAARSPPTMTVASPRRVCSLEPEIGASR